MKYIIHDGSLYNTVRSDSGKAVSDYIRLAQKTAYEAVKAGADHAVYAVRNYNILDGSLSLVDIYLPAIPMTETQFDERIPLQYEASPGCIISAAHKF